MIKNAEIEIVSVAVLLSVYKKDDPNAFKDAVNSIHSQTVKCDLYIFVDGPVSEEISVFLTEFIELKGTFVVFSETNIGLASALNRLIDLVLKKNYTFIARMDSDDVSYPQRIERQMEYLTQNLDVDILGTHVTEFG